MHVITEENMRLPAENFVTGEEEEKTKCDADGSEFARSCDWCWKQQGGLFELHAMQSVWHQFIVDVFVCADSAVHHLRHLELQTEANELHDNHNLKNGPCSSCLLFTALILL